MRIYWLLAGLAAICATAVIAAPALRKAANSALSQSECFDGPVRYCIARPNLFGAISLPSKTPYWTGIQKLDEQGLPYVEAEGRRLRNMSSVALSRFSRSTAAFPERCASFDFTAALPALNFLDQSEDRISSSASVWRYNYDTQVNDVLLKAGWASAFSQSAIIQLYLLAHCKTGEPRYLDTAKRAANAFAISVTEGGLRSETPRFVWFQEIPLPDRHNPFIVNAHLYAIETLLIMSEHGAQYRDLAERGVASLDRVLSEIDTGNWNKYDLRPPPELLVCKPGGHRNPCRASERFAIGQEFDPLNLPAPIPIPWAGEALLSSARPVPNELQPVQGGVITLKDMRWGATAPEYLPWHADLLASIGRRLNRQDYQETAARWLRYRRDFDAVMAQAPAKMM